MLSFNSRHLLQQNTSQVKRKNTQNNKNNNNKNNNKNTHTPHNNHSVQSELQSPAGMCVHRRIRSACSSMHLDQSLWLAKGQLMFLQA